MWLKSASVLIQCEYTDETQLCHPFISPLMSLPLSVIWRSVLLHFMVHISLTALRCVLVFISRETASANSNSSVIFTPTAVQCPCGRLLTISIVRCDDILSPMEIVHRQNELCFTIWALKQGNLRSVLVLALDALGI